MKKFTLAQVLTVTTGKLLCPAEDLYQILNHMTGDNLFTHQLPRAGAWAKPILLATFPTLAQVTDDDIAELKAMIGRAIGGASASRQGVRAAAAWGAASAWVEVMALRLGAEFEIGQQDSWSHVDPVGELSAMIDN